MFGELADSTIASSTLAVPKKLSLAGYRFLNPDLEDALRLLPGRQQIISQEWIALPHVVLSGSTLLSNTFKQMNRILFQDQKSNVIVRMENFFITQRCDIILSKAIAIDQKTQSFYIMVTNRENKITIRLDPITDPEKHME